jgi:hypothetical protein
MKGYIIYHYSENSHEWMDELFKGKRFPVFDFASPDRVEVLDKHKELGGIDAGYYISQIGELSLSNG